jgi:predicted RNase H-like HicB family nuclease
MKRKTYTVAVVRDREGWWVGTVRGVPGVHTQARTLPQLRERAAEALEAAGINGPRVEVDLRLPGRTATRVRAAAAAKEKAEEATAAASRLLREAARELTAAGLGVRDAGELLGLSFQRVHQLVNE